MKTICKLFFFIVAFTAFTACDKEEVIQTEQLPYAAKEFLAKYYPGIEAQLVKKEKDGLTTTFQFYALNGVHVEFDSKGNWTEIEDMKGISRDLFPDAILAYLLKTYPDEKVVKIEKDDHGYDIRLSDFTELAFNKNGQLIDIDR